MDKIFKNAQFIAIVIAAIIIGGVIVYVNYLKCEGQLPGLISAQEAANRSVDYINKNFLQEQADKASLSEVLKENGVYKMKIKIGEQEMTSYVSQNGQLLFPSAIDMGGEKPEPLKETGTTIGNFSVSTDQICQEDGKPIVYFFGANTCPHCKWEHPIVQNIAAKFNGLISFHNNMDAQDKDQEIFSRYSSSGSIPALVLGCKYYRVGSGENSGQETEEKNLTALFCKLTGGNPQEECSRVQDLIAQIPD